MNSISHFPLRRALRRSSVALSFLLAGCIEPPLHLPMQEVLVDMPTVEVNLEVIWDVKTDWQTMWYYGWDEIDEEIFGPIAYPTPTNFEVRRYYLGDYPQGPHTPNRSDGFTIYGNSFRRTYMFGYYDMLFWSNIDSPTQTQVVIIDESSLDEVKATTTATRGIMRDADTQSVAGIYNHPEIFYSAYERDINISRNKEDYKYDEVNNVWVKEVKTELTPLVYIYLVQIILHNNLGRVTGVTGDAALSGLSNGTSVNTGHTNNRPSTIYFPTRYKPSIIADGEAVDIVGGKLTTFGLCDMDGWRADSRAEYSGSRTDIDNRLYFTLTFRNGESKTYNYLVTDQLRAQSHGGIITVHVNVDDIEIPGTGEGGRGDLFVPSINDYDNVDFDIEM